MGTAIAASWEHPQPWWRGRFCLIFFRAVTSFPCNEPLVSCGSCTLRSNAGLFLHRPPSKSPLNRDDDAACRAPFTKKTTGPTRPRTPETAMPPKPSSARTALTAPNLDGWTIASNLVIFLGPVCGGKMDDCQHARAVLVCRGGSSWSDAALDTTLCPAE